MCYHLDKYVWLIFLSDSAFTLIGYFSVCDVLINIFGVLININEGAKNIYEGLVNRFLPNEKSGKAGKVYD